MRSNDLCHAFRRHRKPFLRSNCQTGLVPASAWWAMLLNCMRLQRQESRIIAEQHEWILFHDVPSLRWTGRFSLCFNVNPMKSLGLCLNVQALSHESMYCMMAGIPRWAILGMSREQRILNGYALQVWCMNGVCKFLRFVRWCGADVLLMRRWIPERSFVLFEALSWTMVMLDLLMSNALA